MRRDNMRKFEFVERIKERAMESEKGAYCKLPERSTANSAGYDFYNPERVVLEAGKIAYVKTGVKAYMESGEMLMLCNRSSNPKKKGLVLVNGVGIVDADYADNEENEGEIAFAFMNITDKEVIIEAGEKLGQGIFVKYAVTDDDAASGERTGGFGSTGV
jgi:dUTP pyrophosphatase